MSPGPDWSAVDAAVETALAERVCSAAALAVAQDREIIHEAYAGRHGPDPTAPATGPESFFDLASLTKPLATTLAALRLVEAGRLRLEEEVGRYLTLPPHLARLTARHLLAHCAGLPAWRPYHLDLVERPPADRRARLLELLAATPAEAEPGARTVYSDLGFMLLQAVVERLAGRPLDEDVGEYFYEPLGLGLHFVRLPPGPAEVGRYVASEPCPWRGRLLQGEVNDENAWALGGVAGQAGLFGRARDVQALLAWLTQGLAGRAEPALLRPETLRLILTQPGPDQGRPLGFDAPAAQGSAAGRLFTPAALGHLGFVGTSAWLQPETGLSVVLLTNRTIYGRDNLKIREFRPRLHDLIAVALGRPGLARNGKT